MEARSNEINQIIQSLKEINFISFKLVPSKNQPSLLESEMKIGRLRKVQIRGCLRLNSVRADSEIENANETNWMHLN